MSTSANTLSVTTAVIDANVSQQTSISTDVKSVSKQNCSEQDDFEQTADQTADQQDELKESALVEVQSEVRIATIHYEDEKRKMTLESFTSYEDFVARHEQLKIVEPSAFNSIDFSVRETSSKISEIISKCLNVVRMCKNIFPDYDCEIKDSNEDHVLTFHITLSALPCNHQIFDLGEIVLMDSQNILEFISGIIFTKTIDLSKLREINLLRLSILFPKTLTNLKTNPREAFDQLFANPLICGENTKTNIYKCADEKFVIEIINPNYLNLLRTQMQFTNVDLATIRQGDQDADSAPESSCLAAGPTVLATKPAILATIPPMDYRRAVSIPASEPRDGEKECRATGGEKECRATGGDIREILPYYSAHIEKDGEFETVSFDCFKFMSIQNQIIHVLGGENQHQKSKNIFQNRYKILSDSCHLLNFMVHCENTEENKEKICEIIENIFGVTPTIYDQDSDNVLLVSLSTYTIVRIGELRPPTGPSRQGWAKNFRSQICSRLCGNDTWQNNRELVTSIIVSIKKKLISPTVSDDNFTDLQNIGELFKKIYGDNYHEAITLTDCGDIILITFLDKDDMEYLQVYI
jgi:hypothetical protein